MVNKRSILKAISATVAAVFFFQQIVWAAGETPLSAASPMSGKDSAKHTVRDHSIRVSKELAQIDGSHLNGSKEIVLNIQDCHSSLSAQYSIVGILNELFANYDLKIVAIEGAAGYIDTSILKSHPDADIKKKTAAYLMKEGKISAGEFFAATTDADIALYGAEDNALYRENLECFRDIYRSNAHSIKTVSAVVEGLRRSEDGVYSKDLNTFAYKARLHREGKISFEIYWSFIEKMCAEKGVDIGEYANIKSFKDSVLLEKGIDFSKATRERAELLDRLMKDATKEELEEMVVRSLSFEKGKIDHYEYHAWLLALAAEKGVPTVSCTELSKYGNYVSNYRQLDVIGLQSELDSVEKRLLERLFSSDKERKLYGLSRAAETMESLFEIKLTGEEAVYLAGSMDGLKGSEFARFIEGSDEALVKEIDSAISEGRKALKFYELAEKRNRAMVENTIMTMRREGKRVAALISGGHHSSGLTELMREKGLSYLVLMPKYLQDESRPYVAILTKKTAPYKELAKSGEYDLALEAYFDTGDLDELEEVIAFAAGQSVLAGKDLAGQMKEWASRYRAAYESLSPERRKMMTAGPVEPQELEKRLSAIKITEHTDGKIVLRIGETSYFVTPEKMSSTARARISIRKREAQLARKPWIVRRIKAVSEWVRGNVGNIIKLTFVAIVVAAVIRVATLPPPPQYSDEQGPASIATEEVATPAENQDFIRRSAAIRVPLRDRKETLDEKALNGPLDRAAALVEKVMAFTDADRDSGYRKDVKFLLIMTMMVGSDQFATRGQDEGGPARGLALMAPAQALNIIKQVESISGNEHFIKMAADHIGGDWENRVLVLGRGELADLMARSMRKLGKVEREAAEKEIKTRDFQIFLMNYKFRLMLMKALGTGWDPVLAMTGEDLAKALADNDFFAVLMGRIAYFNNPKLVPERSDLTGVQSHYADTWSPGRPVPRARFDLMAEAVNKSGVVDTNEDERSEIRRKAAKEAARREMAEKMKQEKASAEKGAKELTLRDYLAVLGAFLAAMAGVVIVLARKDIGVFARFAAPGKVMVVEVSGELTDHKEILEELVKSGREFAIARDPGRRGRYAVMVVKDHSCTAVFTGKYSRFIPDGHVHAAFTGKGRRLRPELPSYGDVTGDGSAWRYVVWSGGITWYTRTGEAPAFTREQYEGSLLSAPAINEIGLWRMMREKFGVRVSPQLVAFGKPAREKAAKESILTRFIGKLFFFAVLLWPVSCVSEDGGLSLSKEAVAGLVLFGLFIIPVIIIAVMSRKAGKEEAPEKQEGPAEKPAAPEPIADKIPEAAPEPPIAGPSPMENVWPGKNVPVDKIEVMVPELALSRAADPEQLVMSLQTKYVLGEGGRGTKAKAEAVRARIVGAAQRIMREIDKNQLDLGKDVKYADSVVASILSIGFAPMDILEFAVDPLGPLAGGPRWELSTSGSSRKIKVNIEECGKLSDEEIEDALLHEVVHLAPHQREYAVNNTAAGIFKKFGEFMGSAGMRAAAGDVKPLLAVLATAEGRAFLEMFKRHVACTVQHEMEAYSMQFSCMAQRGQKKGFGDFREYLRHLAATTKDEASRKDYETFTKHVESDGKIKESFRLLAFAAGTARAERAVLKVMGVLSGVKDEKLFDEWTMSFLSDPVYNTPGPNSRLDLPGAAHAFTAASAGRWGWGALSAGMVSGILAYAANLSGYHICVWPLLAAAAYMLTAAGRYFILQAEVSRATRAEEAVTSHKPEGGIRYHGGFGLLGPSAREMMLVHESFASHGAGMLALMPFVYSVVKAIKGVRLSEGDAEYEAEVREKLMYGLSEEWEGIIVEGGKLSEEDKGEMAKILKMYAPELAGLNIVVDASEASRRAAIRTKIEFDEKTLTARIVPPYENFTAQGAEAMDTGTLAEFVSRTAAKEEVELFADASEDSHFIKSEVIGWIDAAAARVKNDPYLKGMISTLRSAYASEKGFVTDTPKRPLKPEERRAPFYIVADAMGMCEPLCLMADYAMIAEMSEAEKENIFIHEAAHLTQRGREIALRMKRAERLMRAYPWNTEYRKMYLALAVQSELEPEMMRLWYLKNFVLRLPKQELERYLSGIPPPKRLALLTGVMGSISKTRQNLAEITYRGIVTKQERFLKGISKAELDEMERKEGLGWLTSEAYTLPSGANSMPDALGHRFDYKSSRKWGDVFKAVCALGLAAGLMGTLISISLNLYGGFIASGAVSFIAVWAGSAANRFHWLARITREAMEDRRLSRDERPDIQIAKRLGDTVSTHPAFENLSDRARDMVIFHESFKKHKVGMAMLVPVIYEVYSLVIRWSGKKPTVINQGDFSNLDHYLKGLEEAAVYDRDQMLWESSPISTKAAIVKQYLPGPKALPIDFRKKRHGKPMGWSAADGGETELKGWLFSAEPREYMPPHVDVVNKYGVDQSVINKEYYRDAFEMLANLLDARIFWTNHMSSDRKKSLHFHIFKKDEPLPVELYETEPICVSREGRTVISRVKGYPDQDSPISAYTVNGSLDNVELLSARCYDVERILRENGCAADKILVEGQKGEVTVYFFPRKRGYAKFFESDAEPRLVGPMAMAGRWVLSDGSEYGRFIMDDVKRVFSKTALLFRSEQAEKIEVEIKRNFDEAEGAGLLPPAVCLKPFQGMTRREGQETVSAEDISRYRQVIDRLRENGVSRLNISLDLTPEGLSDGSKWAATREILKYAKEKGMTTVLSIRELPEKIDRLEGNWDKVRDEIAPWVDKLSFQAQRASGKLERVIEKARELFRGKAFEIYTCVNESNRYYLPALAAFLRERMDFKGMVEWELSRDVGADGKFRITDDEYDKFIDGMTHRFPNLPIDYAVYSRDETDLYVDGRGKISVPDKGGFNEFADLFDAARLDSEANRRVFNAIADKISRQSTYIPRESGVTAKMSFSDTEAVNRMIDSMGRGFEEKFRVHVVSEETIAASVAKEIGLDEKAVNILRLTIWAHHLGKNVRAEGKRMYGNMVEVLKNAYPMAGASIWHAEDAVKLLISQKGGEKKPKDEQFTLFCGGMASLLGVTELNEQQRSVALSLFDPRGETLRILASNRITVPREVQVLLGHYGKFRGLRGYISSDPDFFNQVVLDTLDPQNMIELVSILRVVGTLVNSVDGNLWRGRGGNRKSLAEALGFVASDLASEGEDAPETRSAMLAVMKLLRRGEEKVSGAIRDLAAKKYGITETEDAKFIMFLKKHPEPFIAGRNPAEVVAQFYKYREGISARDYAVWATFFKRAAVTSIMVTALGIGAIVFLGLNDFYVLLSAVLATVLSVFLAWLLFKNFEVYRDASRAIIETVREAKVELIGTEDETPIAVKSVSGQIEYAKDVNEILGRISPTLLKHIDLFHIIQFRWFWMLAFSVPFRRFFYADRVQTMLLNKKAERVEHYLPHRTPYADLVQGIKEGRRKELIFDEKAQQWIWRDGDGIALLAMADRRLQAEIEDLQKELQGIIPDKKKIFWTDPSKLHLTIGTIIENTQNVTPGMSADRQKRIEGLVKYLQERIDTDDENRQVSFSYDIASVDLRKDGSIVLSCKFENPVLETIRVDLPGLFPELKIRKKDVLLVTIGRIVDENIGIEGAFSLKAGIDEFDERKKKEGSVEKKVRPVICIWDQAAPTQDSKYVKVPLRRKTDSVSKRITRFLGLEDQDGSDRDLSGPALNPKERKEESNSIIREYIMNGRVVEVFLREGALVAHRVRWVDGYKPGKVQDESVHGEEMNIGSVFTPDQAANMTAWLESHRLGKNRGSVHFRIILDNAALGWGDDLERAHISHAGYHDGCIYIGERLLASLFDRADDPVRKAVLDEDELLHLRDRHYNCRLDRRAYKERFAMAVERIKKILSQPPSRYGIQVCSSHREAMRHFDHQDRNNDRVRWGNFTPAAKDHIVDNNEPVSVSAGIYVLKPLRIDPSQIKMKIWMGPRDDYLRWSEAKMELVFSKEFSGDNEGTAYRFVGTIPAFFNGDFTFKYSVDGGKTWSWANTGAGDNRSITRSRPADAIYGEAGYGLKTHTGSADYKRERSITLYQGEMNLRPVIDAAPAAAEFFFGKGVLDASGNTKYLRTLYGDLELGSPERSRIIYGSEVLSPEGDLEGDMIVYYDDKANAIFVRLRGKHGAEEGPRKGSAAGGAGYDQAVVKINLDEKGYAREVVHERRTMGIARTGISILLKHSGIEKKLPDLYRLLKQELVLYPVTEYMRYRDIYGSEEAEVSPIARLMDYPRAEVSVQDIRKIEHTVRFSRSRTLSHLALECLKILVDADRYGRDEYYEHEQYVIEKDVLEGMAYIERLVRQDRTLLSQMGIDRGKVAEILFHWYQNGRNKSIYRMTFRMKDGSQKVFAIEVMGPLSIGTGFKMSQLERSVREWKEISDKGADYVPHVYAIKRVDDYRPKEMDVAIPAIKTERKSEFTIDQGGSVPSEQLVYDDLLIVAREFLEGYELVDYSARASTGSEEERKVFQAGLEAYFRVWKGGVDPVTGKGPALVDPKPRNVVVYMVGSIYKGVVADLDGLRANYTLADLMRSLEMYDYRKEDVVEAAKRVLGKEEADYVEANYGRRRYKAEETFTVGTEKLSAEDGRNIVSKIPVEGKALTDDRRLASDRKMRGALNYLAEMVHRSMDLRPEAREWLIWKIDDLSRVSFWDNVKYYNIRQANGGLFQMMHAFRRGENLYLVEGFLEDESLSQENHLARILLHLLMSESGQPEIRLDDKEVAGLVGAPGAFNKALEDYARKCHIRHIMEDDVLGIGPERNIVTYQGLGDTPEARKNAIEFIDTIDTLMQKDIKEGKLAANDRASLAAYLQKRFGVRKFIIGGGKGTRFSPEGIMVKQVFRPDNYNTNLKLARISAAFGTLGDIAVVDTITIFRMLKEGVEVRKELKDEIAESLREVFGDLASVGAISTKERDDLVSGISDVITKEINVIRADDGLRDMGMAVALASEAICKVVKADDPRVQYLADKAAYSIFRPVMKHPELFDESKKNGIVGMDCEIMLDSGEGHGSAFVEALKKLKTDKKLGEARYSIIVYADSPGWGLDKYPNAIFISYLKAVNMFSPGVTELPKFVIAGKTPTDGRAKGRARVYIESSDRFGDVPTGIKEWNDMTEAEQRECEKMAREKAAGYITNANVLICEESWAGERVDVLRSEYRHSLGKEKKHRRRDFEYWASDMLNIAAREYRAALATDPKTQPMTRLVQLRHEAPNAAKTLETSLEYRNGLQEMIIRKIMSLGVDVDKGTTVSISTDEIGPDFDWDEVIRDIFGDNTTDEEKAASLRNIRLKGSIHLDSTVVVERGAILDGTKRDISLTGTCRVKRGVELDGVVGKDTIYKKDILYEEPKVYMSGFPMRSPGTIEVKLVSNVDFSKLGLVTDERTRIWLINGNGAKSDREILESIFGSDHDGSRVRDQIFVYGDVILEEGARVENGTMLDGRSGQVALLGRTHVQKGVNLKGVKASDTTFAGPWDVDIYHFRQPSHDGKIDVIDSVFDNCYIEWGAKIRNSTVVNSCVMTGAEVYESDSYYDVIPFEEKLATKRLGAQRAALAKWVDIGEAKENYHIQGAYRLEELASDDFKVILKHQVKEARKLYEMFVPDEKIRDRMMKETEKFLAGPVALKFTHQQIRHYFFAKVRYNLARYFKKEADTESFRPLIEDMRKCASRFVASAASADLFDRDKARELFRELVLIATRANFMDLAVNTAIFDPFKLEPTQEGKERRLEEKFDEFTEKEFGIDGMDAFMKSVFDEGKKTFVYLPDNIGEAEFDAAVWELLARLGHDVIIAPKDRFAFGDIDLKGVNEIISRHPSLVQHAARGAIKVMPSGSSSEGTFMDRLAEQEWFASLDAKTTAIIAKGQANLFTMPSRNKIKVPVICMLLSKSVTSKRVTGVDVKEYGPGVKKFWPLVALVPDGESIIVQCTGKSVFLGQLKRFGRTHPEAIEKKETDPAGHPFRAIASYRWAGAYAAIAFSLFVFTAALEAVSGGLSHITEGLMMIAVIIFGGGSIQYLWLGRATYNAFKRYIFEGRSAEERLEDDERSVKRTLGTPISYRYGNNIVKFHPAFAFLSETAQELIRRHESFKKCFMGMLAVSPVIGTLIAGLFSLEEEERGLMINADYSNMQAVLDRQMRENIKSGFLNPAYVNGVNEGKVAEGKPFVKLLDRSDREDVEVKAKYLSKWHAGGCNFCEKPRYSSEAARSMTEDWAFSVEPAPVFTSQMIAVGRHVGQDTVNPEYYYDVFKMVSRLKGWQVSWPSAYSTGIPEHLHIHIFNRQRPVPIEEYETKAIVRDRKGEGVVFTVENYPDKDGAIAAFVVKGRTDTLNLLAKRCADLENIIKSTGYLADKFVTKDRNGGIKVYFYPRKGVFTRDFANGKKRLGGPLEMSGIWPMSDMHRFSHFTMDDVRETLGEMGLHIRDKAFGSILSAVEQHFYESEGIGLFPPSMDLMVTYRCNLNCPVCWGSYMPKHEVFIPSDASVERVDFSAGKVQYYKDGERRTEQLRPGSPIAQELETIRYKITLFTSNRKIAPVTEMTFFTVDAAGDRAAKVTALTRDGKTLDLTAGSITYGEATLEMQKRMIDIMYENGMRRMVFTGGEPLVEKNLEELLKYAKGKRVTTWLFTNGLLMDEARADKIMPHVDMISLSLDGYDEDTNTLNRRRGHFSAVLSVLDIIKRKYPDKDVQVLTVVTSENRDKIRKIGFLLREVSEGLPRFQWKLNYYKRIGRSQQETDIASDKYFMRYGEFKRLVEAVQREFTDMRVRFSPPDHDKAYLFVFPDGTLSTTIGPEYLELGNILDAKTLADKKNLAIFREITDNIRKRSIFIPQKGVQAAPDFKKRNIMGDQKKRILEDLTAGLDKSLQDHMGRVSRIAVLIAEQLRQKYGLLSPDDIELLRTTARIHDIGSDEKYAPLYATALQDINKGIHDHPKERVEPTRISLTRWASTRALDRGNIPRQEVIEALKKAQDTGDFYPVYRLYIKYVALERAVGEKLTSEEEVVARNVFSHGGASVELLRKAGIGFPPEMELLIGYHHDHNSLEARLEEMVTERRISQSRADVVKLLGTILITADVFEMGNNLTRMKSKGRDTYESFAQTFEPFNGFMWKRFNHTEKISDTRAPEALKDLLTVRLPGGRLYVHPELAAVIREARGAAANITGWLTAGDRRFQEKTSFERSRRGLASFSLEKDVLFKDYEVAVGVPSEVYDRLSGADIAMLSGSDGVSAVIRIDSSKDEGAMLKELSDKTEGARCVGALLSKDAVQTAADGGINVEGLKELIADFADKARRDMIKLAYPDISALTEESVRDIENVSQLKEIMAVMIRMLPGNRSFRLSEKSIRQLRVENAFNAFYDEKAAKSDRVEYLEQSLSETSPHYLAHFADGREILSGKGPLLIPAGLEIKKRREAQEVARPLDPFADKFFVVAPQEGMSREEKEEFKKKLMDLWLLEGVVSSDDIVILDRVETGYCSSDIFARLTSLCGDASARNAGIRVIAGGLTYDDKAAGMGLLQVGLAAEAANNASQYEVFVNLLISHEQGDEGYGVPGLVRVGNGKYFVYLPQARPVDLENEIRSYYERCVREVLVKA